MNSEMNLNKIIKTIIKSSKDYPTNIFCSFPAIHTCVNPYSYHILRKYNTLYDRFDGIFVDGMTMCWWIRFLWGRKIPRLSFDMSGMAVDLFSRLDKEDNSETIYFIGAKQEAIENTIKQIKLSYPKMNITGFQNGYFLNAEDRQNSIKYIVSANPTFVIVGMGSPLQEQYAVDLKESGFNGIVFTCGGFLHQTANDINYYPKWINKYNLRAFYRLFHERGLWGRLYNVLIEFPILFTRDTIMTKYFNKKLQK